MLGWHPSRWWRGRGLINVHLQQGRPSFETSYRFQSWEPRHSPPPLPSPKDGVDKEQPYKRKDVTTATTRRRNPTGRQHPDTPSSTPLLLWNQPFFLSLRACVCVCVRVCVSVYPCLCICVSACLLSFSFWDESTLTDLCTHTLSRTLSLSRL